MRNLWILVASWALALVAAGLANAADEKKTPQAAAPDKEAMFELREVSAFEAAAQTSRNAYMMVRGQSVECSVGPRKTGRRTRQTT